MKVRVIVQGTWKVCAPHQGRDECPFSDFLAQLERDNGAAFDGLVALLGTIADAPNGPRDLPDSISHRVSHDHQLWQFTKGSVRVIWFYDSGRCVICTHGFSKTTKRTPRGEIDRAVRMKEEYMRSKEDGQLTFEEPGEE